MIPFKRDSVTRKTGSYISGIYKRMYIHSPKRIREEYSTEDIAFGSLSDFLGDKQPRKRKKETP